MLINASLLKLGANATSNKAGGQLVANIVRKHHRYCKFTTKSQLLFQRKSQPALDKSQLSSFHSTDPRAIFHQLVRGAAAKHANKFKKASHYQSDSHVLTQDVYTETGAIASMPKWYKFGMLKIMLNIIAFICVGSLISKTVVNFLDENDIFKPEDEDNEEDDD